MVAAITQGGPKLHLGVLLAEPRTGESYRYTKASTQKGVTAMTTTQSTSPTQYEQVLEARNRAAHALYEAELALHDAHQTHVDQWIQAASDHLHAAVVRHLAADALAKQLQVTAAA
jgi:hypothetical protein